MADYYDNESAPLAPPETRKGERQKPDWNRFGLSAEQQQQQPTDQRHGGPSQRRDSSEEPTFEHHVAASTGGEKNEIYAEDQVSAGGRQYGSIATIW